MQKKINELEASLQGAAAAAGAETYDSDDAVEVPKWCHLATQVCASFMEEYKVIMASSRQGGVSELQECAEVSLRTIFRAVVGWGPLGQWGADLLKVVGDSVSQLKVEALLGEISDSLTTWQSSDRMSRALSAIQSLTDSFQGSIKDDKMVHDIEAMSKLVQILNQLPTRASETTQTLWSMTCSAVRALGSALIIMIKEFRQF